MSEDLKPIVPEQEEVPQAAEELKQEQSVETEQPAAEAAEEKIDYSNKGLKEIADIFQELLENAEMQKLYKHAEALKAAFYKTLRKEKIAAGVEQPKEGEEPAGEAVSTNPFAEVERGFKELYNQYKAKRAVFVQEQEKKKEENYKEKTSIIEELKALVDKQEDVGRSFPLFRELQNRWRAVGPVAQDKVKNLYDTYQHYVEMFYDYVKINKEMRDLDFKKNLEAKEELCAKAEALADLEDVPEAFRTLQRLHEAWKELGPVSKENREAIWDRFKAATSVINKKHQAYFDLQKGDQKENFEAKSALCEKVEEIAAREIKDSNTWNSLSKEIENIQKEWKTIGFASKKDNQKVYDRFRAACDEFFAKKRDFYSDFKSQMQDNMAKKLDLCEKAEALKNSEEWKKTADALVELQRQWKEIGPVTRKKSEQVWKRFRAACDEFFENRDKHLGAQDEEQVENLNRKRALIDEIKEFVVEGKDEARAALKEFQSRWNEIGFVPIKEKNAIQDEFRSAINQKFAEIREGGSRFMGKVDRTIRTERDRLVQKFLKKEQDIATWENNMGFFAKSKNADALLEELNKKIDIARQELADLEAKIKEFDQKTDQQ